jgi:hypothetical protein
MRDRADEKGNVDHRLGVFPGEATEAPVEMQEIVLHVDNDQGGAGDIRAHAFFRHLRFSAAKDDGDHRGYWLSR